MARDLPRVVDVAAAVEDRHVDPPRRWQDRAAPAGRLLAAGAWDQQQRCEDRQGDQRRADHDEPGQRIALNRQLGNRQAGELARLPVVDPERARVQHGRGERIVGPREAVDAALFEPPHLLRREARAAGGLLDR